ncbi:MAG: ABC transporter permease [Gammaproteobacteria bacterium]|nr:ABC transporter permease [Gammaproteobacteria bacterium]
MRAQAILGIWLRQWDLLRGSPTRILPTFAWVAVDIVLWGFITRYLDAVAGAGFLPRLLGAVLLWDFFTRVMQGVTVAFFEDLWSRNFLNLFATPLSVTEYVGGLVLSSIVTSALGLAVMLLLAGGVFGLHLLRLGLLLAPFLLLLFGFGVALGVLACAMVLRLGPASEWLVWPIPALLAPFAGVFYPLATLPGWMQAIGRGLPPSYVFEGMRAVLAGHHVTWFSPGIGLALTLVYVALAGLVFGRVFRYTVASGLLARYSAESVS